MDWNTAATAFAAAAGGLLTMTKVLQAMDRRRNSRTEKQRHNALFLNGDKEEVIRQVGRLMLKDRESDKSLDRIESAVRQISRRLDRAGIPE